MYYTHILWSMDVRDHSQVYHRDGLKLFVVSGCDGGRDGQELTIYCFIFLFRFSDSLAVFLYVFL